MKNRNRIIVIVCVSILMVLMLTLVIKHFVNEYKDKHELDDLEADELLSLTLESNYLDEFENSIKVEIDFEKRTMIYGTRKEFKDNNSKEVVLTEEQSQKLKKYIVEYTHNVKAKEKEYWPQTDEYPDMFTLFNYKIEFGDGEVYRTSGALCYPDDWEIFIEKLTEY